MRHSVNADKICEMTCCALHHKTTFKENIFGILATNGMSMTAKDGFLRALRCSMLMGLGDTANMARRH